MKLLASLLVTLALATPALAQTDDSRRKADRDLFERVVEIPTVEGRGNMGKLTTLLSAEFRKAGITHITIKKHGTTESMIVRWPASGTPTAKPILLMAHMDVVEAKRGDWKYDPFEFREEDGYYLGRGTADNKSGVVSIVQSLARLKKSGFKPRRDLIVLFTGDEETAQDGARLASTEWRSLVDAEYALNSDSGGGSLKKDGTPVGFGIQVAEKTYATYSLTATNRGGHSSGPRPDNAIYQLANALSALEGYRFPQQLDDVSRAFFTSVADQDKGALGETIKRWLADPNNDEAADLVEANMSGLTRTRCVATRLEGGHADNALPQMAKATVNCRIFPGVDPKTVEASLRDVAGQHVVVAPTEAITSSAASPLREDVLNAYSRAIRARYPSASVVPNMSAGATDGLFFRAIGIPVYGVGAGWGYQGYSSGAHGLDERTPVQSFHERIDMWTAMLSELAG